MTEFSTFFAGLLVYLVGTASPGPANLSIANAAMNYGRKAGLVLASGVISGSLCWGVMTGIGVSALLASHPAFIFWLKIAGAVYLLWLGYQALRRALSNTPPSAKKVGEAPANSLGFYLQGLGIHLTNPKAVLTWFTVTSVGLSASSPKGGVFLLVGSCALMGMAIFCLYAVAFSARSAEAFFLRTRRGFDLLCVFFYLLFALGFIVSLR
jgi:threonine/homoserine/homoserine lactone efflux protein